MEEEFVTYEQALALKELGFDEDCFVSFFTPNLYSIKFTATTKRNSTLLMGKDGCTAPLKQQTLRWFREKNDIVISCIFAMDVSTSYKKGHRYSWDIIFKSNEWIKDNTLLGYLTYEEAENACIDELIEIAKNK
jgi:hypothetical protein